MTTPGGNVLNRAMRILGSQTLTWFQFTGNVTDARGVKVPSYADPVTLRGSFQPLPRAMYERYGLSFQKDYYVFYVSANIMDLSRDTAADQLSFNGIRYQCESANAWFNIDGWVGVLCVRIPTPPGG